MNYLRVLVLSCHTYICTVCNVQICLFVAVRCQSFLNNPNEYTHWAQGYYRQICVKVYVREFFACAFITLNWPIKTNSYISNIYNKSTTISLKISESLRRSRDWSQVALYSILGVVIISLIRQKSKWPIIHRLSQLQYGCKVAACFTVSGSDKSLFIINDPRKKFSLCKPLLQLQHTYTAESN